MFTDGKRLFAVGGSGFPVQRFKVATQSRLTRARGASGMEGTVSLLILYL